MLVNLWLIMVGRSSKKSRLSAASDVESCSVVDGVMNGRSASLVSINLTFQINLIFSTWDEQNKAPLPDCYDGIIFHIGQEK